MMRKTTLAVAVASALALPVSTYASGPIDGSLYGKVNISVVQDDNGTDDVMTLNSNASRIGVKGKTKLSDTLYVIYKAEFETYWDDGKGSDSKGGDTFEQRNIIAGLKGNFGTVWAGKHDTPTKMAQKKIDLFNDLQGDIKQVLAAETRSSNIVNYTTPNFSGFSASFANIFGEDRNDGDQDNFLDSYSLVAQYDVEKFYVAIAYDENVNSGSSSQGIGKDFVNVVRLVGQVPIGPVTLGALWQNAEEGDSATPGVKLDEDSWHVSVKWKVGNGYTLKTQYTESDDDVSGNDADMLSLGVDKALGKKTKLFAFYTTLDESTAEDDLEWIGVGLEHKF